MDFQLQILPEILRRGHRGRFKKDQERNVRRVRRGVIFGRREGETGLVRGVLGVRDARVCRGDGRELCGVFGEHVVVVVDE